MKLNLTMGNGFKTMGWELRPLNDAPVHDHTMVVPKRFFARWLARARGPGLEVRGSFNTKVSSDVSGELVGFDKNLFINSNLSYLWNTMADPLTIFIVAYSGLTIAQALKERDQACNTAAELVEYVIGHGTTVKLLDTQCGGGDDDKKDDQDEDKVDERPIKASIDSIDVSKLRSWHKSKLTIAEAYALLWQNDDDGAVRIQTVNEYRTIANFVAAHIVDLLLLGLAKVVFDETKRKYRIVALQKLEHKEPTRYDMTKYPPTFESNIFDQRYPSNDDGAVMAPDDNLSRCKPTEFILDMLACVTAQRITRKKGPVGLSDFIKYFFGAAGLLEFIRKDMFTSLVGRGIVSTEKRKIGLLGYSAGFF